MKLLGWMHRKLCHNSNEQIKDVIIGSYGTCLSAQSVFDDRDCHTKHCFGSRYGSGSLKQPNLEFQNKWEEDNLIKETTTLKSEIFDGFLLAIGTLGSEPILSEPGTPTFPMSSEDIVEEHTEVTQNDLKLINDELEKFLEAEADEEGNNESSRRSSYVSIVTLIGKPLEGTEQYEKTVICPFQGYLLGSSVEVSETKVEVMKVRASLGELFQRAKLEEDSPEKCMKGDIEVKQPRKSAKHPIKKFLKKLCASSIDSTPSTNADSGSKKKKLHKLAQMFHRKIHPENPIDEKELHKDNGENTKTALCDDANGYTHIEGNKKRFPHGSIPNEGTRCYEAIKLHRREHARYHSSGNREHWIKTDADYLVLEL